MTWRRRRTPEAVWRGVFNDFDQVSLANHHTSREWVEALALEVDHARRGDVTDEFVLEHEALLLLLRGGSRGARVIDFGGGLGQSYAWVRRVAPDISLRWLVVELAEVAAHGLELFTGDRNIAFSTTADGEADIVFVRSALQYVADWSGTLAGLFRLGARFLILEKFSGVASRTYATAQVNLGATIPYWFLSFDAVFRVAADAGYERVLWRRLPRIYDQSEFPPELQMGQASTIIFAKV